MHSALIGIHIYRKENMLNFFKRNETIYSPCSGLFKTIAEVNDELFASKKMGDGFAVVPADTEIYSPITGVITMLAPSKHAIGIESKNGTEIMIHMGIDTVELNGTPFTIKIKKGDKVKRGQLLANFDYKQAKDAGKETDVIVIILNNKNIDLDQTSMSQVNSQTEIGSLPK